MGQMEGSDRCDFRCYPKLVFLIILGTPRQVEGEDYETAMKSRVFIEFHQCFIIHVFFDRKRSIVLTVSGYLSGKIARQVTWDC